MLPTLPFGRTGHASSRIIFGGAALWTVTQDVADRALDMLLGSGVNHVDVAPSYGVAEDRVGDWIARHGRPFFLATKTLGRTAAAAREELQRSLERLHVEHLDLWQLHSLTEPAEIEVAFGPGGALEAAVEARAQGLVRHIGLTGHGTGAPAAHRQQLERFAFDSILLPLTPVMQRDARYAADFQALMAICRERGVAVQTIKGLARARWADRPRTGTTWYETLAEPADIDLVVHWILGHAGVFLNTPGDLARLPAILDAAERFRAPPDEAAIDALICRRGIQPIFGD